MSSSQPAEDSGRPEDGAPTRPRRAEAPTPGTAKGDPCDGCHECGLRCTSGVQMTRTEFDRIVAHLRSEDPERVGRVLDQEKRITWFEEIQMEACLFYDTRAFAPANARLVVRRGCLIYPVRPFICRLFGRVEWLPCPIGRPLEKITRGLELIQAYARERRGTFARWCTEAGIFDLRELASKQ